MDRHIKEVLGQYLKKSKVSNGYQSAKLIKVWQEKMGPSIAQQTEYFKLRNNTVTIKVTSSVLKFELFQSKDQIKEFLNEALGTEIIREVRFI